MPKSILEVYDIKSPLKFCNTHDVVMFQDLRGCKFLYQHIRLMLITFYNYDIAKFVDENRYGDLVIESKSLILSEILFHL